MCTAANYITERGVFFGRNYDYEISFHENIYVTPRNFPLAFRYVQHLDDDQLNNHQAMIGVATGIIRDYPLYYDAANESGLCMAGLNFANNAVYNDYCDKLVNIAPFELIPYVLTNAENVKEAKKVLSDVNIIDVDYSSNLPNSPLHWMISDVDGKSIVVEPLKNKLKIYKNDIGVLTNNPPFDYQKNELNKYMGLSVKNPSNDFGIELNEYSRGMGAYGLPGDYSSTSRFIKASFVRANSKSIPYYEMEQFFKILESVQQPRGLTLVNDSDYEYTIYSSCYNDGFLLYKTYLDNDIKSDHINNYNLNSQKLIKKVL